VFSTALFCCDVKPVAGTGVAVAWLAGGAGRLGAGVGCGADWLAACGGGGVETSGSTGLLASLGGSLGLAAGARDDATRLVPVAFFFVGSGGGGGKTCAERGNEFVAKGRPFSSATLMAMLMLLVD